MNPILFIAFISFTFVLSFGQDSSQKMPPLEMLSGGEGPKHIIELEKPSHYSIYDMKGEFVDSGFAEFIDYTDFEPGHYFLNYDSVSTRFEREVDTVDILNIQEENKTLSWKLIALLCLTGLIVILFTVRLVFIKKQQKFLLKEIDRLKANTSTSDPVSLTETSEVKINKEQIEEEIGAKLNESDWKIINELILQPSISNKQLSSLVALSIEGCRSSLKKMYRLFEIPSSRNMRLTLVIKLIDLSRSEQK